MTIQPLGPPLTPIATNSATPMSDSKLNDLKELSLLRHSGALSQAKFDYFKQ